jgi:hypothetical protein
MIKINYKEKCLVDCETAEILRPDCFDTLVLYYSYLISRKHENFAEKLLEDVMSGKKVITKMIDNAAKHGLELRKN